MKISVSSARRPNFIGRRIAGSTLIESFFAVSISGIFFTSLFAGLNSGMFAVTSTREQLRATQIIADKFETIRLYSWDQINTDGFIPSSFTASFQPETDYYDGGEETEAPVTTSLTSGVYIGTLTIEDPPASVTYTNDMKSVTVEVRWESANRWHTNSVNTLISRYGIQNYVY